MSPEEFDEKTIGLIVLVIVLAIALIMFMALFFKEHSKNSQNDSQSDSQSNSINTSNDVSQESTQVITEENVQKDSNNAQQNTNEESPSKVYGNGLIYNKRLTKFEITDAILPIITEKIFDDDELRKCVENYKLFINKEVTFSNRETVEEYCKILMFANSIMNTFKEETSNKYTKKLKDLRDLYYDIIANNPNASYVLYKSIDNSCQKVTNKDSIIKCAKNILTHVKTVKLYLKNSKDLETDLNSFLNEYNDDVWNKIKDTVHNEKTGDEDMRENANNILSTSVVEPFKDRYYKILDYSHENYIYVIKEFFEGTDFIENGYIYQYTDNYISSITDAGQTTIFSKDDTLRYWYNSIQIYPYSGKVSKTTSERLIQSVPESYDPKFFAHADIIPSAFINATLQVIILKFIFKKHNFGGIDKNILFDFLMATKLNMIFVNMLSNVVEDREFNNSLSSSFHAESK